MIEKVLKPMWKVTYTSKEGYTRSRHYANKAGAQNRLAAWIVGDLLPIHCERFYYSDGIYCHNCSSSGREKLTGQVWRMLKSGKSVEEAKVAMDIGPCVPMKGYEKEAKEEEQQARDAQARIDTYADILEGGV